MVQTQEKIIKKDVPDCQGGAVLMVKEAGEKGE